MNVNGYEIKPGASLSGADLSRASLYGADLSRANLSGANLSRADLYGADLSRANLSGANLSRADLDDASLDGADLSGANLSRADLYGANLESIAAVISLQNVGGWHAHGWIRDGRLSIRIGCREFRYEEAVKHWAGRQDRLEQWAATEYIRQVALARGWTI